ncbi:C-X-C motif chemokine 9 isoform X2 [Heterocephalus glaber]|uniref:C-X-C motif chemokine n=1 Tax=Heterocephalus glaber TaxID=10181 RepID=A0AAX6PBK7_HETGA|nr:C-X-C motif chemokine 9 isoform X2 [Heterocephalus glaber]
MQPQRDFLLPQAQAEAACPCRRNRSDSTGLQFPGQARPRHALRGTLIMKSRRCSCINTSTETITLKSLKDLKKFAPTPSCEKTEIIATKRNGNQICLNPDSAKVKELMKQWEKQVSQKKKQKKGKKNQNSKKTVKVKRSQAPHQKKTA